MQPLSLVFWALPKDKDAFLPNTITEQFSNYLRVAHVVAFAKAATSSSSAAGSKHLALSNIKAQKDPFKTADASPSFEMEKVFPRGIMGAFMLFDY